MQTVPKVLLLLTLGLIAISSSLASQFDEDIELDVGFGLGPLSNLVKRGNF